MVYIRVLSGDESRGSERRRLPNVSMGSRRVGWACGSWNERGIHFIADHLPLSEPIVLKPHTEIRLQLLRQPHE